MGDTTTNYGLFVPDPQDSMADVKKNLTDTFTLLSTRADPTVISNGGALPQSGNYSLGDRVCRLKATADANDYTSSYILVCKDANWGWHWRPVQRIKSPWVTLPSTVINDSNWSILGSSPLQISLDYRGRVWWRGAIQYTTAGIPTGTSYGVFKNFPKGICPNHQFMHTVAVSPFPSGSTGIAGYYGGRFYSFGDDATSSMRFFNTNNGISRIAWLNGMNYWASDTWGLSG